MSETGIVRRIDELGRVVIPKEMRKTLRIKEGDPLEIYANKEELVFKKYSPIGELGEFASQYAESLSKAAGIPACITDKDNIIAVSGIPKNLFEITQLLYFFYNYHRLFLDRLGTYVLFPLLFI